MSWARTWTKTSGWKTAAFDLPPAALAPGTAFIASQKPSIAAAIVG